ncbi:origin recognition complex subunit 3-like [Acanthaster planci]|uniref:Origin recognition complex subunit 3 n=1 Tax=Acanthaster planci TaxID=133434 RepID=A0A8B7Z9Q7_ACAPL|nr:origin recognition complex subunit 3-like [Acanthaster planci]
MCADSLQTSSVSKGCFVFKAKMAKKALRPGDYMCQDGSDSEAAWFRCNTYEALWDRVSEGIEALQSEVNEEIFSDLIQFVKNGQAGFEPEGTLPGQRPQRVIKEIPTAAFIAGVNVTDHSATFAAITTQLKDQVTPHVANLLSRDCNNLRALMSSLVSQLMGTDDVISDDEEELNIKKIPATMPVLRAWYHDTAKKRKAQQGEASPPKPAKKSQRSKKRRSSSTFNKNYAEFPPVVILFEDLESFTPRVLQDFILICSEYLSQLPLVLLFGIATSVAAIHRILPQAVSSLLSIEKFQAKPSTVYLSQLISKVLLTPSHPFKLGHKVFQLLLDIFLFHDFSVINFVKGLQFAMMDHFFSHPLSLLCCNYGEGLNRLRTLAHDQLELFRQAASFRTFVEGQPPEQQRALLLDDKHLKKTLQELLKKLVDYHRAFYPLMECLNILTGQLPHHPLGKQQRELYSMCLEGNVWESAGYKEAFSLLKLMARDELMALLEKCIERLTCSDNPLQDARFQLETLHTRLATIAEDDNKPQEEVREEVSEESRSKTERVTLRSLQQKLMESVKKTRKPTKYESLVNETLEFFDSIFRKHLVCPNTLTFHEIFYYNSVSDVRHHINASPRAAIQTALNNPSHYLQSELCKAEPGVVLSTMPDVCIAYKLHMECGRLINLYDWLQAFITVVTGEQEQDEGSHDNSKKPDPQLQARFIRAVSELQFLGFIKATRKKTDHVARLTWGGI